MWLVLALAIFSGLAAGYLMLTYLQPRMVPAIARPQATTQVVVATRDLAAGTVLAATDVKTVEWPEVSAPRGHARTTSEVVGRGLVTAVAADEPLLAGKLAGREAGGGLSIVIPEGMRAVSVKVDDVIGVAGFVLPGTRVDVLATLSPSGDQQAATTRIILQNVQAIAAGQTTTRDAEGTPQSVPVITLLVTPEEAEMLTLAATKGQIHLALRNLMDTAEVETPGVKTAALAAGAAATAPSAAPVRRRASAPRAPDQSVITYNGSERSVATF
jgi:pilus assembly protein CpaB